MLGGEPLAVVERGALERSLGGAHALRLALLARAQFAQALGVHALELFARLLDLAAVLRRLLQARLPHLVVAHAAHLLLHLRAQARLALLLERAMRSSASRARAARSVSTARSCISSICASRSDKELLLSSSSVCVWISRLAPAPPMSATPCSRLTSRGGAPGASLVGLAGRCPAMGPLSGEHSGELLARHHLLVREPALGLEHGQRVAVVLRGEVLHVQAVRRPLPQLCWLGPLLANTPGSRRCRTPDQARPERTFQALDGAASSEKIFESQRKNVNLDVLVWNCRR